MYKYIKYNNFLLNIIKSNQKNNIYKLIKNNINNDNYYDYDNDNDNDNDNKLKYKIMLNRTINRLRYTNIYDDIIFFSKYIKQEIDCIYNLIINHDAYENFKNMFYKTIDNKLKIFNNFSILLDMYLKYYKNISFIKDIIKEKKKNLIFVK